VESLASREEQLATLQSARARNGRILCVMGDDAVETIRKNDLDWEIIGRSGEWDGGC